MPKVYGAGMQYYKGALYMFGGFDYKNPMQIELYKFDIDSEQWTRIEILGLKPPGRIYSRMMVHNSYFYILHGYQADLGLEIPNLWRINLDNPVQWEEILYDPTDKIIEAAKRDAFGYVVNEDKLIIFGGFNDLGVKNDILTLDLSKLNPEHTFRYEILAKDAAVPTPRASHAMEIIGEKLYILGGVDRHGSK